MLWGHGESAVKSVFRNLPGQASHGHGPDDWEGILGRGKPGNPVQHLLLCSHPPPPSSHPLLRLVLSVSPPLSPAASLSAIKTLYNQGGTVMGKWSYVRLVERGKQQNSFLHISAAAAALQPNVPRELSHVQYELRKALQTASWRSYSH